MPEKEWLIESGELRIRVWRITRNGQVEDFAVTLMAWIFGKWECVTRYDCAHGSPHRDVLGARNGLRDKLLMDTFESRNDAYEHAIRDIKENAQGYLADFLAH